MKTIENYRNEIDEIDNELIKLFEKRMDILRLVAQYKKENNIDIFNQSRENEVLKKSLENIENKDYEKYAIEYMKKIMELSKKFQFNLIK